MHQKGQRQFLVTVEGERLRSENFSDAWPYEHIDTPCKLKDFHLQIEITFSLLFEHSLSL